MLHSRCYIQATLGTEVYAWSLSATEGTEYFEFTEGTY